MNATGAVSFEFEITDSVTAVTEKMAGAQDRLATKAKATTNEFDRQRMMNIECLTALNSFRGGIRQVASSMHELGMVDDATYETMSKLIAGVTLFTATAETLKSAVLIYNMLTAASSRFAISSIFAAAAQNPILAAAAIGGASLVAYGAISAMNQGGSSSTTTVNKTTNINYYGAPDSTQRTTSLALTVGSYY